MIVFEEKIARTARVAVVVLAVLLAAGVALPAAAQTQEERIEELERQVEELRSALEAARQPAAAGEPVGDDEAEELARRIDLLAAEIERLKIGEAAVTADRSQYGLGPAATKVYRVDQGLSIGGYGEMLYQNRSSTRDDGAVSGSKDQIDFLRAIVYFGYKFNDRWVFNSELEFEHASTGSGGEASVEFAYLDYLWRPELNARAGLLLVPMGLTNELHEPTVFLGARRPDVEQRIIPTTWRENGFGVFGDVGPVSYRSYIVNGLEAAGFSAAGLRGGRQKGAQALAEDFAWVGRVDYNGFPGLLVGGSVYLGDSGQGVTVDGEELAVGTTIYEGHVDWRWRGLQVRALAAQAELDDVVELNRLHGDTNTLGIAEEMGGWYVSAAYDVLAGRAGEMALSPYVRWEEVDTQKELPPGFTPLRSQDTESLTLGLAFQPIDNVVIKADWQDYDNAAGTGLDQWNVALGYIF
ncbi:MAG TPA: hypothetical protein VHQ65_15830 [Thermoanaerobaculia bacterium]|nr:hypothetical protein [Thermoanaerobaculia bacterium]